MPSLSKIYPMLKKKNVYFPLANSFNYTAFFLLDYVYGRVTLAMLAKFFVTIAFDAAYLLTFEILPTTLR